VIDLTTRHATSPPPRLIEWHAPALPASGRTAPLPDTNAKHNGNAAQRPNYADVTPAGAQPVDDIRDNLYLPPSPQAMTVDTDRIQAPHHASKFPTKQKTNPTPLRLSGLPSFCCSVGGAVFAISRVTPQPCSR